MEKPGLRGRQNPDFSMINLMRARETGGCTESHRWLERLVCTEVGAGRDEYAHASHPKGPGMIVLGLLLIALAVAGCVVAVIAGGDTVVLEAFDMDVDLPAWGVFAAGVGTGLLLLLGIVAVVAGANRARARREEIEYLREQVARHERQAGRDGGEAEVGEWLGSAHGRNRPTETTEAARPGATSGAAPLYRQG